MAVAGGSSRVQIEPSDPLFLHPSDQPEQGLVADLFNGDDFENWRRSVTVALSAKQKLGFVDGTNKKPEVGSPLLPYWQRCNDMVISWLLNSLHKNVRDSVLYHNTASDIWTELNERYGQSNKARLFQAQKAVSCISQGDQDIANYFNQARKAWDEVSAVGSTPRCGCNKCECEVNKKLENYDQEKKIIQFLMGLNESYTAVRGNILMMSPFPSLSQIYSLLVQEERQRQVKVKGDFQSEASSFVAGINNAPKFFPAKKSDGRRSSLFCDHCKRPGHTMDKCYKIHGYPNSRPGGRGKPFKGANNAWNDCQETQSESPAANNATAGSNATANFLLPGLSHDQSRQLLQFLTNLTAKGDLKQESSEATASTASASLHMAGMLNACNSIKSSCTFDSRLWILDTGASDHMSSKSTFLHDLRPLTYPMMVNLPNGTKVQVTQSGSLRITDGMGLHNVLLVPEFQFNLLSIRRLCDQLRSTVQFLDTRVLLQAPSQRKPLVIGRAYQGLYVLDKKLLADSGSTTQYSHFCNNVSSSVSFNIWHQRLGHMSCNKMKLVPGVHFPSTVINDIVCEVCPKAKQPRLPFPVSHSMSTEIFQLLHVDTWGPYHTKTYTGHRYFLTIVDDCSRATWTHLMVTKDEAMSLLKAFTIMVKTQFGKDVKIIRSDNALELSKSYEILDFFTSFGITHQTSCVHTPQQNGVVERKHRHLLEVSRALMFQASLPLRYWGDCVLAATHLINRLPTKVLQGKTPYEKLHGTAPTYNHLRVFGCLCFMTTQKQGRDKFQPRAKACVFLGYPTGQKRIQDYGIGNTKDSCV